MISVSGKFTPAALTLTTTWPLPGFSAGTSSTTSFSGGPSSLHSTAFIQRSSNCILLDDRKGAETQRERKSY